MFIHPDQPAALVILCPVGQEVSLHLRIAVIGALDHSVSLFQHSGHRICNAGGIGSIQHLHSGIAVHIWGDVHKAAGADQCRVDSAVRQDVAVVHGEDLVDVKIIVFELPETQPVAQGVHRLGAPA